MRTHLKLFSITALTVIAVFSSKAQTPEDVLKHGSAVTFFGIDFSRCKGVMLGATAEEMRVNYFPAINTLLLTEEDKYSVKNAYMKSDVKNTLYDVNKLNQTLDVDNFNAYSAKEVKPLDTDAIAQMIQRYDLKDETGIGLVFIAEYLDKTENIGLYHLVYFTMPDGKVIINEKVSGKPKGFGMRNYWAHSIHEIIDYNVQMRLEQKYLPKKKK
jgi:hypothetical protein